MNTIMNTDKPSRIGIRSSRRRTMYLSTSSVGGLRAADRRVPGKRRFPGTLVSRGPGLIGDQEPASFQTLLKYSDWVGLVT